MKKDDIAIVVVIILITAGIFVLGMLTQSIQKNLIKYEYYTLDGEKGYSYHCEAKDEIRCEIDGNLIKVAQFSEAE